MTDETTQTTEIPSANPIVLPDPAPLGNVPAFLLAPETTVVVEHPAVSIISEIESHLANIPMFGYSETQIRKLVAHLKTLF